MNTFHLWKPTNKRLRSAENKHDASGISSARENPRVVWGHVAISRHTHKVTPQFDRRKLMEVIVQECSIVYKLPGVDFCHRQNYCEAFGAYGP